MIGLGLSGGGHLLGGWMVVPVITLCHIISNIGAIQLGANKRKQKCPQHAVAFDESALSLSIYYIPLARTFCPLGFFYLLTGMTCFS